MKDKYMIVGIHIYTRDLTQGKPLRELWPTMDNIVELRISRDRTSR